LGPKLLFGPPPLFRDRPAVLNGIEDIVTRPDLADRAVFLALEALRPLDGVKLGLGTLNAIVKLGP